MEDDFHSETRRPPVIFRILTARRIGSREGPSQMIALMNEAYDAWNMNYYEVEDTRDGDRCVIMINRSYYTGNVGEDEVQITIRNVGRKMEAEPYPKRAHVEGVDFHDLRLRKHSDKSMIEGVNARIENEDMLLD